MKTAMTLAELTNNFWYVSKAYNGKTEKPITVYDGLNKLGVVVNSLGPHRKLRLRALRLRDAIIIGPQPIKNKARG